MTNEMMTNEIKTPKATGHDPHADHSLKRRSLDPVVIGSAMKPKKPSGVVSNCLSSAASLLRDGWSNAVSAVDTQVELFQLDKLLSGALLRGEFYEKLGANAISAKDWRGELWAAAKDEMQRGEMGDSKALLTYIGNIRARQKALGVVHYLGTGSGPQKDNKDSEGSPLHNL